MKTNSKEVVMMIRKRKPKFSLMLKLCQEILMNLEEKTLTAIF